MTNSIAKHRFTGEQIAFLESNDEHSLIEVTLPPIGDGPSLHKHDQYRETFTVVSGTLEVTIQKETFTLTAGQSATVELNQNHRFTNTSDEPVTFRVDLTPACDFESAVRIHYGLMDDGYTDEKGTPINSAHLAAILYLQNTWIAGIPIGIQRAVAKFLIRRANRKGQLDLLERYANISTIKSL